MKPWDEFWVGLAQGTIVAVIIAAGLIGALFLIVWFSER